MKLIKIANQIVVFHGTNHSLDNFSKEKQISGYYPGFYVSTSEEFARDFGRIVYQFIFSGKLYEINTNDDSKELKRMARAAGYPSRNASGFEEAKYLEDNGYAGIKRGKEYIIFNPEINLSSKKKLS